MKSLYQTSILLLFSLLSLACATNAQEVDSSFCGNKHKNLVFLKTIFQDMPNVVIPEFIGIPTKRIENFLQEHDPAIFTNFKAVIDNITCSSSANSIERAEKIIDTIQEQIKTCFANHAFFFVSSELQLFEKINQQQQFFMVRSTGIEDGAVANAGGNTSIAYVLPTQQAIQKAMGQVVASYFGMQSLKSRLSGGEKISSHNLCIPILIQVLVGESFEGASDNRLIPVSGVAYTTNQSLSSQNFAITEINAAYGHGEGVVANRVIADRYYVTPSRVHKGIVLYPMVYQKYDRLVPHRDENNMHHALISKANNKELAHKSALSRWQIEQLYLALKKIESAYQQPMDVEFVILDQTIYIVQARPAMHVTMQPSYVDLTKISTPVISEPIYGDIIVPGTASVVMITNPDDIIVAKTIDEADQMPNSTRCKAVIVGTWASSLSHPAVNFKTYGIPCMMVTDLASVKKMVTTISKKNPCIFDPQQRCIFSWQSNKAFNIPLHQGWLEHPIDRTYSLLTVAMPVLTTACSIPHDGNLMAALNDFKKAQSQHEYCAALSTIADLVRRRLELTQRRITFFDAYCSSEFTTAFLAYKTAFEELIHECTAGIDGQADHFELLFYHKMLEAILYQSDDTQKVLGGYTYTYFLNDLYVKQAIFTIKKKLGTNSLDFVDYF